MLSICITSINSDIKSLLVRINQQANELNIDKEILIYESGIQDETQKDNEELAQKLKFNYTFDNKCLNLSCLKNKIAKKAKGTYLLFLDGHMHITSRKFLSYYTEIMQPGVVVYGGISAPGKKSPTEYELNWMAAQSVYGLHSDQRTMHPYFSLRTGNMMIPRAVFLQYPLQENSGLVLSDMTFAYELKQNKVPVLHIDNPIVIRALLSNIRFLAQSRKDVRELAEWMKQIEPDEEIEDAMSEYKKMKQLTKYRISNLFDMYFGMQASDKIQKMISEGKTMKAYKQFRQWSFLKEFKKK